MRRLKENKNEKNGGWRSPRIKLRAGDDSRANNNGWNRHAKRELNRMEHGINRRHLIRRGQDGHDPIVNLLG